MLKNTGAHPKINSSEWLALDRTTGNTVRKYARKIGGEGIAFAGCSVGGIEIRSQTKRSTFPVEVKIVARRRTANLEDKSILRTCLILWCFINWNFISFDQSPQHLAYHYSGTNDNKNKILLNRHDRCFVSASI